MEIILRLRRTEDPAERLVWADGGLRYCFAEETQKWKKQKQQPEPWMADTFGGRERAEGGIPSKNVAIDRWTLA